MQVIIAVEATKDVDYIKLFAASDLGLIPFH
jgi:hypothetical protein